MKTLKQYIKESILDDEEKLGDLGENIIDIIERFLKDNYKGASKCKISKKPNENGKYVVVCNGDLVIDPKNILSLTNKYFIFGKVKGNFDCSYCSSLTSLDGAPEVVDGDFYCYNCFSLTSLKGAPEKVGGNFYCHGCKSLTSLKGAPEVVGKNFDCSYCSSLTTLEGAPKKVGGDFTVIDHGNLFTREDIEKISKVVYIIYKY